MKSRKMIFYLSKISVLDDGISKRYIKYNNSKIFTVKLLFYGQEIKQFTEKKSGLKKGRDC